MADWLPASKRDPPSELAVSDDEMAGFGSMPALSSTSSSSSSSGAAPGTDPMGLAVSDMETFNACIAFDEALL